MTYEDSYFEKIRQREEHIIYAARFHWFYDAIFHFYMICALTAIFVYHIGIGGSLPFGVDGILRHSLIVIAVVFFVAAANNRAIKWSTHVIISDRRIIHQTGLVARRMEEISARRIAEVNIDQSVMGRILDFGKLHINDVGSGAITLPDLDNPLELKKAIDTIALKQS